MILSSNTKRVLAVMAVATALCADQISVAAPVAQPAGGEITQIASRLVSRLTRNLRRVMPAAIEQPRRSAPADVVVSRSALHVACVCVRSITTPSQFPLPPPTR